MAYKGQPRAGGGTEIKPGIGQGEAQVFQPVQAPQQDTASIQRAYADKAAREERLAKEKKAEKEKLRKEHIYDPQVTGIMANALPGYIKRVNDFYTFTQENTDNFGDVEFETEWQQKKNELLGLNSILKEVTKDFSGFDDNISEKGIGQYENEDRVENVRTPEFWEEVYVLENIGEIGAKLAAYSGGVTGKLPDLKVIALAKQAAGGVGRSKKQTDISAEEQYDNNAALQEKYSLIEWQGVVWNQRPLKSTTTDKTDKTDKPVSWKLGGGETYHKEIGKHNFNRNDVKSQIGWDGKFDGSIEIIEYEMSKAGGKVKDIYITDPVDNTKQLRLTVNVYAFRTEGNGKWRAMYEYTKKYIDEGKERTGKFQDSVLLEDVAGKIWDSFGVTEEILNDWERREREAAGTATPGTSSGTTPSFQ